MKILTRALSALKNLVLHKDDTRHPSLKNVLLRQRDRGVVAVGCNGKILVEVLHLGEQLPPTGADVLVPPALADKWGRLRGEHAFVTLTPSGEIEAGGVAGTQAETTEQYPMAATQRAIDDAFTREKARRARVTFDLHLLGDAIDALRRVHPRHRREDSRPVLVHLYLLTAHQGLVFTVLDQDGPKDVETRGIVMPVDLHGDPRAPADGIRPLDLRAPRREKAPLDDIPRHP